MALTIRKVQSGEAPLLWRLYHDTIHHVNFRDYTAEQIQAWAPDEIDHELWREKIEGNAPYVCLSDETIVGYADLQSDGLIDHFFVDRAWQRKGVGRRLFATIESEAANRKISRLYAHVSITARAFFESCGFEVVKQQEVSIGDVALTNFLMSRSLGQSPT